MHVTNVAAEVAPHRVHLVTVRTAELARLEGTTGPVPTKTCGKSDPVLSGGEEKVGFRILRKCDLIVILTRI